MEVHLDIDLSPVSLACARFELQLMRQKLAIKRMAFIFELELMKKLHAAYLEDIFYSQRKHTL